jgi:hypothetical protein
MIHLRGGNDEFLPFMMAMICELLVFIPIMVFILVCRWKIFVKAGQEGWKSIVPIYGSYVYTIDIAGKDMTTFILHFIPFANIYSAVVTNLAIAKKFGKDDRFGIGLTFLAIIFLPWLAFDKKIVYQNNTPTV